MLLDPFSILDYFGWGIGDAIDSIIPTVVQTGAAVMGVINACRDFFSTLLMIGGDLQRILEIIPLPASWIAILTMILTVIVVLRIYAFIKDVEILGFKI